MPSSEAESKLNELVRQTSYTRHVLRVLALIVAVAILAISLIALEQFNRKDKIVRYNDVARTVEESIVKMAEAREAEYEARVRESETQSRQQVELLEKVTVMVDETRKRLSYSILGYKTSDASPQIELILDSNMNVLWMNSTGENLTGYLLTELVGYSPNKLLPVSLHRLHEGAHTDLELSELKDSGLLLRMLPIVGGGYKTKDDPNTTQPGVVYLFSVAWANDTFYKVIITPSALIDEIEPE